VVIQKLFSIITPVLNSGPKIRRTVESVRAQQQDLFEHIIVDGQSTDDTLAKIKSYEKGITFISENDRGVYDAMNKGIDRASGKYLYFLGAGDSIRPAVLENVASLLLLDGPAFIYGDVFWEDSGLVYAGEFTKAKLKERNICHQAVFYDRRIFDLIGKYELRFKVLADWVLNIKCFGNDQIRKQYIDCIIANFEGGGFSLKTPDETFNRERAVLFETYLKEDPGESSRPD
jgi:glycosyltransferase involved in cell wall biosynthesis